MDFCVELEGKKRWVIPYKVSLMILLYGIMSILFIVVSTRLLIVFIEFGMISGKIIVEGKTL